METAADTHKTIMTILREVTLSKIRTQQFVFSAAITFASFLPLGVPHPQEPMLSWISAHTAQNLLDLCPQPLRIVLSK